MPYESSSRETALFYSELLQAYFDSTDDAIFVLCDEMKFLSCNRTLQDWLGLPEQVLTLHNKRIPITELLGENFDTNKFSSFFQSALKGEAISFELFIDPEKGKKRWTEIHLTKVDIESGDMVIAVARDISERKKYIATIDYQSNFDALTELPNRNSLISYLLKSQDSESTSRTPLTLIAINLDRFKEINESLGQQHGDYILQEIARRLNQITDTLAGEFVARLGGDAFALVFNNTTRDKALATAKIIRKLISKTIEIEPDKINLDCGIGIASLPENTHDAGNLIQLAEAAMHTAKKEKIGISIFSEASTITSKKRLQMITDLREAIKADNIKPHYQPIREMRAYGKVRVEALARWKHEMHGYVSPALFIQLAEEVGVINLLTSRILDNAIRECADSINSQSINSLSINISSYCLSNGNFVSEIKNLLKKYFVPPKAITLELTESAMMTSVSTASETITRLHELGLTLSIDDFGTGYSSLSKLKQLPIRELKIDKSFIVDLENNEEDAAITRASIQMAHSLGLEVVAEGIEDKTTWNALKLLGCDYGQGYWIAKPMDISDLIIWLDEFSS
jgi:diguanylate cyclase (GGDEF)-like protein/PAS domain S-box-containing protein